MFHLSLDKRRTMFTLYTEENCPMCVTIKKLLTAQKIEFEEVGANTIIDLENKALKRDLQAEIAMQDMALPVGMLDGVAMGVDAMGKLMR